MAWSECVAAESPNYSPETIDTAWLAICEWLGPRAVNREFEGPERVHAVLERDVKGHRMAKAAVEMGFWLLAALLEERSLSEYLGGTRERLPVGISIGIQEDPAALVEKARAAYAAGYRKVKAKIRPGTDFEYLRSVREEVGPEAPLAADANAAYTLDHADRLARLDDLDLIMLEQPLEAGDLVRHARLQERLRTPICLDESITGASSTEDMIALGSGRIMNVKPGRVGGFTPSIAVHDLCAEAGIPVWCGGMLESGVGRGYNVALASLPAFELPGDLSPSERYWKRDIVTPEWTMDADGTVAVPRGEDGLGVTVDRDRVEELTVRTRTIGHVP